MRMARGVTGERKKGGKLCLDIIGRQRFQNDKMGDTKKEAEGGRPAEMCVGASGAHTKLPCVEGQSG